jgi:hypothetical protein
MGTPRLVRQSDVGRMFEEQKARAAGLKSPLTVFLGVLAW